MCSVGCPRFIYTILTNIIIVMRNIGFATSPDRTTVTPENHGATIDKMDHELPTICS